MKTPSSAKESASKVFFNVSDFEKIKKCKSLTLPERLKIIADMIRWNALTSIMNARSGHIGASFSVADILAVLYHSVMNVDSKNPKSFGRDIMILSKGHAASSLYVTLASRGFFPTEKLLKFRRLNGLEGHAEISAPGVDSNTGSLAMGISKGKGYAWSYKASGSKAAVFVIIGDGELQEGQNWEAIMSAGFLKLDNLCLIIDRNRVQTDKEVRDILDVSPVEAKLKAFGWHVITINGNDTGAILESFKKLKRVYGKPKAIVANTLKGTGVSFMEHPRALKAGKGFYKWHDKLPNEKEYRRAWAEIISRISKKTEKCSLGDFSLPTFPEEIAKRKIVRAGGSLLKHYSEILVEIGKRNKNVVVMDADLAESCGLREFENKFPKRFIEVGIAEQDMVSMAGGLALSGMRPIVNTYASFLTSRANEQIFNNASEGTKIIYVGHIAGIIPAKPGKSHQGLRDITVMKSIPNILVCQPCNSLELRKLLNFLVAQSDFTSYLRLEHAIPKIAVHLPVDYEVRVGQGATLADGNDAIIIGYGPLLLSEALIAREILNEKKMSVKVVNLPWLNCVDEKWLKTTIGKIKHVFCLENHSVAGGMSDVVARALLAGGSCDLKLQTIGVEGFGRSGEDEEILKYYEIDASSIVKKIWREVKV